MKPEPVVRRGPGTKLIDRKTGRQIEGEVFWKVCCPACGVRGSVWNNGRTHYVCQIAGCGRRSPIVEAVEPDTPEPGGT